MVGMRELNLLNTIIICKHSNYSAIVRIHNIDDLTWLGFNGGWTPHFEHQFGEDAIYGVNITSREKINFATQNLGGSYAYGYQIYKAGKPVYDSVGGAAYITGIFNNATYTPNWYRSIAYTY